MEGARHPQDLGIDLDGRLNWTPQKEVPDRKTSRGPAVAGTSRGPGGSRLFTMAYRGVDKENIFVSTSSDGVNWSPEKRLDDRQTKSAPSLTYSDSLHVFYMAWRGQDHPKIWVSYSENGVNWSPEVKLTDRGTQQGPIALTQTNTLVMAFQGEDKDNIFVSSLLP